MIMGQQSPSQQKNHTSESIKVCFNKLQYCYLIQKKSVSSKKDAELQLY